jgi:CO/xanthine dehydrogenase Mo-binding subunit
VKHVNVRGRAVFTNNPFTCAFRGFGVNQMTFAMEQQVSKLAHAVQIDAAALRERNLVRPRGTLGAGTRVPNLGALGRSIREVNSRGAARRLPQPHDGIVCGRGLATAIKNLGYGFGSDDKATAEVQVTRRGAVVRAGAADVGQGTETIVAQIAASELQLPMSRVRVEWQDNARAPESGSSSSSRQTMAAGNAVLGACRLAARAISVRGGRSRLPDEGIVRQFTWRFPKTDKLDTRKGVGRHIATFSAGSCVADVAVDTLTGQVRVLRIVSAIDAGRMMNPCLVRGQVEGGAVMGQGYALTEACATRDGMPTTAGFDGSGIPTAMDAAPRIETIVLESPDRVGPLGARGIGEITMIPVVPAIVAAIHDACGVWIDELPANPERIRAALAALKSTATGD